MDSRVTVTPPSGDPPLLTIEQFEQLPEEDAHRIELVRGRVLREPRPGYQHGWLIGELYSALKAHVDANRLGRVFIDVGTVIATEPATVRGPDLVYHSHERSPGAPIPVGFSHVAPDLCVEVVSPSNRTAELMEKIEDYLGVGVRAVWVVYPRTRRIVVHTPGNPSRTLRGDDVLEGGEVLPGFRLSLSQLFSELD
jgi:Uma2 family endonuclease